MRTNTKYILSVIALFILTYFTYRFYVYAHSGVSDASSLTGLIITGVILAIAIGLTIALMNYFRTVRDKQAKNGLQLSAEINAYGIMAEDVKYTTIKLIGTAEEYEYLHKNGKLILKRERFNLPMRIKDKVIFYDGDDVVQECIRCTVGRFTDNGKSIEIAILN